MLPTRVAGAIGTAAIALAFVCGVAMLICLLGEDPEARHHASSLWDYANVAGLDIKLGIFVDPLSVFMVLVVTGVSTLIHLYSFGYMQSDEGYRRFFSYLNFFVFSMLLLVLAGNFVLLIVGWAFVGFASYALISFWYRRTDGDQGRDEGVRDQRRRRHRPRPRRDPDLPRTRDLRLPAKSSPRRRKCSAPTSGR